MKRQGSTELPRFAVGALATAGASVANGATVQITFNGSYISSTLGNQLDTDFGDDGDNELNGWLGGDKAVLRTGGAVYWRAYASLFGIQRFGSIGGVDSFESIAGDMSLRGISPFSISFSDASIRGGAPTLGYLDLTASVIGTNASVTVNRLIFDDATGGTIAGLDVNTTYDTYVASAVPEASTSLGLLALGAGGLLARRRRSQAA